MKKICLISGSSPEFLGGISLYQRNLITQASVEKLDLEFTWIYPGKKNKKYTLKGIKCVEINSLKYPFLKEFDFARKTKNIISKQEFDVINTHANWGYCLKGYNKKENQKIIHTFHGITVPYIKIQLKRFGILKRLILSPLIWASYILEKPPMEKAEKVICVSEKVKLDLEKIYWKRKEMIIIRTGVDIKSFKKLPREKSIKELRLKKDKIYGLYSGRGGYWNKGLDRAISIGKKIYKKNKNFKLIVLGADKKKCKKYLKEDFVIYRGVVDRKNIPKYYSACDFFFSLSRYEGGAPTLVVGEAMASGCFIVFSKDSKPEIIENEREGLIIKNYGKQEAKDILEILEDKKKLKEIKENAYKKIKELSLEKWGRKYLNILTR